jgi:hypothetical protein
MTTDQEAEDMAAAVLHRITQRGITAREAERRAQQWEATCKEHRGTIAGLERQLSELCLLVGAETHIAAFTLAETWRAEKQGYMEQIEETRGVCLALCDLLSADPGTIAGQTLVEAVAALLAELTQLRTLARAVVDSAARELSYSPDVLLVDTSALRALARCLPPAGGAGRDEG